MTVAQKLTIEDIQAKIEEAKYINPTGTLTICILTLTNGFLVTGESVCLNPADFNADTGNKIAYDNAEEKVWMLEAYLRQEIAFRGSEPLAGQPIVLDHIGDIISDKSPPSVDMVSVLPTLSAGQTIVDLPTVVVQPHDGLEQYLGIKIVNAKPMTRAVYNQIRGWVLPPDENGDDAGYLVEYTDAQRPNLTGFEGYVSWSPADVFEGAYTSTAAETGNVPASSSAENPSSLAPNAGGAVEGADGGNGSSPSTDGQQASSTGGGTTSVTS